MKHLTNKSHNKPQQRYLSETVKAADSFLKTGAAIGFGVLTGIVFITIGDPSSIVFFPPLGTHNSYTAFFEQMVTVSLPFREQLTVAFFWLLSGFMGAAVSVKCCSFCSKKVSVLTGVLLLLVSSPLLLMHSNTGWMVVTITLLYLPASLAGGAFARKSRIAETTLFS